VCDECLTKLSERELAHSTRGTSDGHHSRGADHTCTRTELRVVARSHTLQVAVGRPAAAEHLDVLGQVVPEHALELGGLPLRPALGEPVDL